MSNTTPEDVAVKAKSSFSLVARAKARPLLTRSVTVYLDEVAGDRLGGDVEKFRELRGIPVPDGRRRWGIVGEIAKLAEKKLRTADEAEKAEIDARVDELLSQAEAARADLEASKHVIHIQGLPSVILEDARGKAYEHFGLEVGDDVPENIALAHQDRYDAEIVSRMVTGITGPDGEKGDLLSVEDAEELPGALPPSEYARFRTAVLKLQHETKIAEQATDNADF